MHTDITLISVWLLLAASLVAVYYDVRFRRIPNWLTASVAVAAIVLHSVDGFKAAAIAVAVMVVMTFFGVMVYGRGGFGGGDVKLAIAGTGLLSFPLCVPFLLYTMIGGGLLAIVFIVRNRSLRSTLARVAAMTAGGMQPTASSNAEMMPYAIAFAFGAFIVAISQSYAPFLRITV